MSNEKGKRTVLAFDFGVKSIGVAFGSEFTGKAQAISALKARDGIPNEVEMAKLFTEWKPDYVVVGLPLNMDGSYQEVTYRAKKFGNRLCNKFHIQVIFKDERLTTKEARATLYEDGGYKALEKGMVDSLSAVYILEGYFSSIEKS